MNNLIKDLYEHRDKEKLSEIKNELSFKQKQMDLFFDEYLEVFDDKMNASSTQDSPEWKAYKDKYKEYTNLKANLKLAEYYLGML
jgi:hypothetical protein